MRAFLDQRSRDHDPDLYFRRGRIVAHPEQAERWTRLRAALDGRHVLTPAPESARATIEAVHAPDYVDFLEHVWERRTELPDIGEEILSGHFARPQMARRPDGLLGLVGWYLADTSTPIRAGTWSAALASASVAAAAADAALEDGAAYALCRPPGHHAYADSAGGFCFLNNTAIAAQRLRGHCERVAILDIDVHHGNGTQGIFYARGDVLTVSVNADPSNYFPYYAGYADETGIGEGAGANLNLPLVHGSGDAVWLAAIERGLSAVSAFGADALVVALGLDASQDDPIGALKVTTPGFSAAGTLVAGMGLPTAIVQEGGYLCEALPRNLRAFLDAFDDARPR